MLEENSLTQNNKFVSTKNYWGYLIFCILEAKDISRDLHDNEIFTKYHLDTTVTYQPYSYSKSLLIPTEAYFIEIMYLNKKYDLINETQYVHIHYIDQIKLFTFFYGNPNYCEDNW